MAAKKKAASGNIEARLAALRADFEALQTDMKGLYGDVSEVASERAALAMRSAEEIADRAVALAEVEGPAQGLAAVDRLDLDQYHLWHATRADLLRRLDRRTEAVAAYDAALSRTTNEAERRFLVGRRDALLDR